MKVKVMLDPGHGGIDSGTVHDHPSITAVEKELNLNIARYARRFIQRNYAEEIDAYMTRIHDDSDEMKDEAEIEKIRGRRKEEENKIRV